MHVYPGMGATAAMYGDAWRELAGAVFHDWPQYAGETSIAQLARRVICEHDIAAGDLVIDGGHLLAMTHAEACVQFIREGTKPRGLTFRRFVHPT